MFNVPRDLNDNVNHKVNVRVYIPLLQRSMIKKVWIYRDDKRLRRKKDR